jgi:YHS domain-containing protein
MKISPNLSRLARLTFTAVLSSSALVFTTLSLIAPGTVLAFDINSTAAVDVDAQGVGIHGYDPVSYFSQGLAVKGSTKYQAHHAGVSYYFSSSQQRDTFMATPTKFAPQFGGFCAMGVALGKKLDGDPEAWRIVDGKLYLNVNKDIQKKWLEDVPGNLKRAGDEWPSIKDKAPKEL